MAGSSRVTLGDLAEKLDLTKVSISKALRDHPDISSSTKAQVQELAQELGYMPNRLAQSLSTDKSSTIGVVVPKIAHTFFSNVLEGVNAVATENDYEVILCVSQENQLQESRHLRTLLSLQVDGLLISVSEETEYNDAFQKIEETDTPFVFVDRTLEGVSASKVVVDDKAGAREAIEHAIRSGYERIAHIAGENSVDIGRKRRAGYVAALQENNLPVEEDLIVESGFDEAAGYYGMQKLLNEGQIPEALFAVTTPVALGAEDAICESDLVRNEQIQIYSFGQHSMSRFFENPHISVQQPAKEMGKKAFSLLLQEITHSHQPPQKLTLPTQVVEPGEIQPSYKKAKRINDPVCNHPSEGDGKLDSV